jgi:hypothetical protein
MRGQLSLLLGTPVSHYRQWRLTVTWPKLHDRRPAAAVQGSRTSQSRFFKPVRPGRNPAPHPVGRAGGLPGSSLWSCVAPRLFLSLSQSQDPMRAPLPPLSRAWGAARQATLSGRQRGKIDYHALDRAAMIGKNHQTGDENWCPTGDTCPRPPGSAVWSNRSAPRRASADATQGNSRGDSPGRSSDRP